MTVVGYIRVQRCTDWRYYILVLIYACIIDVHACIKTQWGLYCACIYCASLHLVYKNVSPAQDPLPVSLSLCACVLFDFLLLRVVHYVAYLLNLYLLYTVLHVLRDISIVMCYVELKRKSESERKWVVQKRKTENMHHRRRYRIRGC